jgi:hypothetical protein
MRRRPNILSKRSNRKGNPKSKKYRKAKEGKRKKKTRKTQMRDDIIKSAETDRQPHQPPVKRKKPKLDGNQ